jgi:hypothetical protein
MKLFHFPWLRRLLGKGVNTDVSPELVPDGLSREAINVRPSSIDGRAGAIEAVRGEVLLYPSPGGTGYVCIGSASCNGRLVEFWASSTAGEYPIVRLDGIIVAQSQNIPYVYNRPLQLAVVEDLVGTSIADNQGPGGSVLGRGVVYPADHNSEPLYWDIRELLANYNNNTGLYFDPLYTTEYNSVQLISNPEFPVHVGNVEAEPGLPPGQYQYRLRWVTPQGDRTNPGPETPLISIPIWQDRKLTWQQDQYPGVSTVGGAVLNPLQTTGYGAKLQFRVDNQQGFEFVEVLRRRFNDGTETGVIEVVGKLQIVPGEVSIRTFTDPFDTIATPEVIPPDEEEQRLIVFTKPKSVEYADRRLTYANFESLSNIPEVDFVLNPDGDPMAPITQGVHTWYTDENGNRAPYNDGYSDPVNNTYLKSFMRGEKYGLGVMFWDAYLNRSYVAELPNQPDSGYQFPNRRDKKSIDSATYSSAPIWAASTDCNSTDPVYDTFDAFIQGQRGKNITDLLEGYNFVNYYQGGGSRSAFGPTDPIDSGIIGSNDQTRLSVSPVTAAYVGSPNDAASQLAVASSSPANFSSLEFSGRIWSPQYQALGGAIYGINNLPEKARVFSIMRTEPANRVIAQGIASYSLINRDNISSNVDNSVFPPVADTNYPSSRKNKNRVVIKFPDFDSGKIDLNIIDEFVSSPQNFAIQFVSPLGIYSEPYSFGGMYSGIDYGGLSPSIRAQSPAGDYGQFTYFGGGVDMLSYAGVQYDEGQVNVNEPRSTLSIPAGVGMAYQPTLAASPLFTPPASNYVGYSMWRRFAGPIPPSSPFAISQDQGNKIFETFSVTESLENGNTAYIVTFSEDLYLEESVGDAQSFNSSDTRNWHEPVYVVNLIRKNAQVPSNTIDRYINTGHHIKIQSCIGIGTGQPQTLQLLNERPEDVFALGQNRYLYVQANGEVQRWLCLSGNTALASLTGPQQAALAAQLNAGIPYTDTDGNLVYGLYEFSQGPSPSSFQLAPYASVSFGNWNGIVMNSPPANARILTRYDSRAPIRFFGGDTTIAHSASCIINDTTESDPINGTVYTNQVNGNNNGPGFLSSGNRAWIYTSRPFNVRLPYIGWKKNAQYIAPVKASTPGQMASSDWCSNMVSLRQWVVLWDAEQRSAYRYAKGNSDMSIGGPYEWPRVGYVIKPYIYDSSNPNDGMFTYPNTNIDGVDITVSNSPRDRGGIPFANGYNKDYWKQPFISGFGVPFDDIGGYQEKRYFPTGFIASLEVDPLLTDTPGLRTFIDSNLKVVSEENGEIKVIASVLGGGGRNMYGIAERGVVRVLTNKNILTGASGEVISTQSIANYWGEEMWLSRDIGSPDQMWQFFVRGFSPTGSGYADSFYFADRNSVYRMVGDQIIDIARERFLAYMLPILRNYPQGYVVGANGFYNRKYNEAWMTLVDRSSLDQGEASRDPRNVLVVYSPEINNWVGRFTYSFDRFTQVENTIFGHRALETFRVDIPNNYTISGITREASITVPMVGDLDSYKEFIRWRISGDITLSKPDKIQILDPRFNVMCEMPGAGNTSPYWVKHYDGWEGWADRTLASYDPDRKLPQNQYFYLRLIWNTAQDKAATAMSGQLKPIK